MFHARTHSILACFLCAIFLWNFATPDDENRPYEFAFNITDFQHRYERKDSEGLITGEYGFITADGVYHETGYATDKNGDFIITRMTYRRIKSLKDAQLIFKDRPEAAKRLVEAVTRACGSCKVTGKLDEPVRETQSDSTRRMDTGPLIQRMLNIVAESKSGENLTPETNQIPRDEKNLPNERTGKSLAVEAVRDTSTSTRSPESREKPVRLSSRNETIGDRAFGNASDDIYYRFNYTITSHGHQEEGYRSGKKDGGYRAPNKNGVDIRVRYLSNEFGHQPNVSLVPSENAANETERLKGYSFEWYWS